MANMRGHKMLYKEGWYVVSSSSKALEYARQQALMSSGEAIEAALASMSGRTRVLTTDLPAGITSAADAGKQLVTSGTEKTGEILRTTHRSATALLDYSSDSFGRAVDAFVRGNLSIAKRTEADRRELISLPGNYFLNLRDDFSNISDLTKRANDSFAGRIEVSWDRSFQKASDAFRSEYERSAEKPNTLAALGPILYGYLKAFYHGLAVPASSGIVKGTASSGAYGVFLPTAAVAAVAGRTVQSVGLTFYYTGKTGIKVLSPTMESGLLAGMALLSAGAVPVTYVAGGAAGAVNQVAFTAGGPAFGTVAAAAGAVGQGTAYVGLVTYDAAKGATTVVINQASTGVVLGYNALTAIPTHALLAAGDAAVFLAWDGPKLVIAAARGTFRDRGEERGPRSLPVGTVVDLRQMEKVESVKIEVLSTDEAVIRDVLERTPSDLRGEERNDQQP